MLSRGLMSHALFLRTLLLRTKLNEHSYALQNLLQLEGEQAVITEAAP